MDQKGSGACKSRIIGGLAINLIESLTSKYWKKERNGKRKLSPPLKRKIRAKN